MPASRPDIKRTRRTRRARCRRYAALALVVLLSLTLAACSLGAEEEDQGIAQYGEEGARFARKLAAAYPRRTPYSHQEKGAADLIVQELKQYGFEPEIQNFSVTDEEGTRTSANVLVRLQGKGFTLSQKSAEDEQVQLPGKKDDLIMVIGAHYDTPRLMDSVEPEEEEEGQEPEAEEPAEEEEGPTPARLPDGIHNNASGVAAVLTAARIMRQETPGYQMVFVFFGAGTDSYAGARHYLSTLPAQEREKIDVMVNIGPIFAGDKVYAHAGQNSVRSGNYKDYAKRRKLYQMTDIFFENQLNSRNKYAIYTNQASFLVEREIGGSAVFREWTTKQSDHTPFDEAGIPVVFMESGDYRIQKIEEVEIESRNPLFQETGGRISGTVFDRTDRLEELFRQMDEQTARQTLPPIDSGEDPGDGGETTAEKGEDGKNDVVPRLPQRINNTAFVLVQLARKGPLNYDFAE